ncbi:hypothetical protein HDU93_008772 [Gonapodya sp. JEL0774]|nr:hypothetical protein HDU93_008772 [Gonapodya sp. JEL0774]
MATGNVETSSESLAAHARSPSLASTPVEEAVDGVAASEVVLDLKETGEIAATRRKSPRTILKTIKALTWGVPPESDPRNYSQRKKIAIAAALSGCSLIGALGQHIYVRAPSLLQVQADFGTTTFLVNLTISVWAWCFGFAPTLWSVMGDNGGRKRVYFCSWTIFICSCVICWQSTTINILIFGRALQGASACAVWIVGAGTISDLFEISQRGRALGYFQSGGIIGPILGPPLGGVIGATIGWRATFAFLLALGALGMLVILLLVPETIRTRFSTASSAPPATDPRASDFRAQLGRFLESKYNPLSSLRFLGSWLTYAPSEWSQNYGFNETIVGLAYLPFAIGQFSGAQLGGYLSDREIRRSALRNNGVHRPEDRLRVIPFAMIPFSLGVLGVGWSVQAKVHFVVPLLSLVLAGLGFMVVNNVTTVYLVDIFTTRASAISALIQMVKTGVAASAPLWSINLLGNWGLVVVWGTEARSSQSEWIRRRESIVPPKIEGNVGLLDNVEEGTEVALKR